MQHEIYMQRCLQLAKNGVGNVAPNPLVGCVIVFNNKIIGEGYHKAYGTAHAEVNAIQSVSNKCNLKESTLYVNLEPCNHFGKTPPCSDFIIENKIKKVVIGCQDPFSEVNGKGIDKLKKAGIDVIIGVLESECKKINNRFFIFNIEKRPYTILKWAQTKDGLIDIDKNATEKRNNWITNATSKQLVHKWRSEEQAILIGTNTAINDNPFLTTRDWPGKSPVRIIIDRKNVLPKSLHVFNSDAKTIVLTEKIYKNIENVEFIQIDFANFFSSFNNEMYNRNIQSVIIEGGKYLLDLYIKNNMWDEARVFIGNKIFGSGLQAPAINLLPNFQEEIFDDSLFIYLNKV